jgi:hypothetical protein
MSHRPSQQLLGAAAFAAMCKVTLDLPELENWELAIEIRGQLP